MLSLQKKDYERTLDVLKSFEETLTDKDKLKRNEKSEIILFYTRIYEDMGNF